jgi:hypothetical protein
MEKTILLERKTLQKAVLGLLTEGKMKELFEGAPLLSLLMPVVAIELSNKLFGEEEENEE